MALQSPNMHENGTNWFVSNYVTFTVCFSNILYFVKVQDDDATV